MSTVPDLRIPIRHGVDELARACLSALETAKPEDRLAIIRAHMTQAVGTACIAMADGAKKGVDRAALLILDPDYFERRQQRRARNWKQASISDEERKQKSKGIVQ
jgi:2-oxo-4-hydroxy-4-carboxy--5-ureidoimidazoline (OHCU) decarboxylase